MKFFISAILSAVLLFSLSACGISPTNISSQNQSQPKTTNNKSNNAKTNNSSSSTTTNKEGTTNQGTNSTKSPSSNINSSNGYKESEESFYGQWQIKKVIAYGPVGTYSSDDINTLTDKYLTFSRESATCFGEKMEDMNNTETNPVYKKIVISKNDFPSNYRVTFEQLGINGDSVTEVEATGTKGICTVFFITPNNNKLILYGGGTFFELDKFSNQNNSTSSYKQATNRPTGAWVDTFEKQLYQGYQVTPSRYQYIGNGSWEVWVKEVDTGQNSYVTVNENTGDFHG